MKDQARTRGRHLVASRGCSPAPAPSHCRASVVAKRSGMSPRPLLLELVLLVEESNTSRTLSTYSTTLERPKLVEVNDFVTVGPRDRQFRDSRPVCDCLSQTCGMSEPVPPEPDESVPESPPAGPAEGGLEPNDADRQAMIDRIQQALAEDQIDFADIDDRFVLVYAATTEAELDSAAAGLPELRQPPPPVAARHLAPQSSFSLFGDVKIGGWVAIEGDVDITTGFGHIVADLSAADLSTREVTVTARSVFGSVKVIVTDGARVQTQVFSVFGGRKEVVTAGSAGGPLVRVRSYTVFGSSAVYSLSAVPVGALRRLWTALRAR